MAKSKPKPRPAIVVLVMPDGRLGFKVLFKESKKWTGPYDSLEKLAKDASKSLGPSFEVYFTPDKNVKTTP